MTRQSRILIVMSAHGVSLTLVCALAVFLYIFGQRLEPIVIGPVIEAGTPIQGSVFRGYVTGRDGHEARLACFSVNVVKKRRGDPLPYQFDVETSNGEPIRVNAYLAKDHRFLAENALAVHDVGEKWVRNYCFDMPGTISDNQEIRVSGNARHRTIFPWISMSPLPPFKIQPLNAAGTP